MLACVSMPSLGGLGGMSPSPENFRTSETHFGGFSGINTAWYSFIYLQNRFQMQCECLRDGVITATWTLARIGYQYIMHTPKATCIGGWCCFNWLRGCGLLGGRGVSNKPNELPLDLPLMGRTQVKVWLQRSATFDIRHLTHLTSVIWHPSSDIHHLTSIIWHPSSGIHHLTFHI